jgi:hypothetical protein
MKHQIITTDHRSRSNLWNPMFFIFDSKRCSLHQLSFQIHYTLVHEINHRHFSSSTRKKNCNNEVLFYNIKNIKCPEPWHFSFTIILFLVWERSGKAHSIWNLLRRKWSRCLKLKERLVGKIFLRKPFLGFEFRFQILDFQIISYFNGILSDELLLKLVAS